MTHIVYVKFSQITELTHKDVLLKDVAQVYCKDKNIQNKCSVCKVMTVRQEEKHRYVANSLDIVRRLEALDPGIQVTSMGEEDFIIAYKPPAPPSYLWQWAKTGCVCAISFFGAAFAIMTFNNDVSVTQVFSEVYRLVMGYEAEGATVLEASYSIGLALEIVVFFNHISSKRLNTDPTPLEVEMRLYEENICKTLIDNSERKENKIDVS